MSSLTNLPQDLLVDTLLPTLPVQDLLALGSTNHALAQLTSDEVFWKRKCEQDFNFSGARTARRTGWKKMYKGLNNPKVFVWGSTGNGRLGLPSNRLQRAVRSGGIPYPVQIHVPGARIVDLVSGGWSFFALDSEGQLYVWGTLDGSSYALYRDGFSVAEKTADTPHQLRLPEKIRSVSCGRKHALALDTKGGVWTFLNWGRPYLALSPLLDHSSPETTVVQVECGWTFCAVLTQSGDVLAWWPFGRDQTWFNTTMEHMDTSGDEKKAKAIQDGQIKVIPCSVWRHGFDPTRVPTIPVGSLPELSHSSDEDAREDEHGSGIKLVKIAAMESGLVGLTNRGHVLVLHTMGSEQALAGSRWEYLPLFSETARVREHPAFTQPIEGTSATPSPPSDVHITHISANYRSFSAYSVSTASSIVLTGSDTTTADVLPTILPSLQNQSVISVVLGDYHKAALTADGRLLTWGTYSQGALGLGDPANLEPGKPGAYVARTAGGRVRVPEVEVPTEVGFGKDGKLKERRERFVFAVAAAGWHTGALVYDLDGKDDDEADDLPPSEPDSDDDFLNLPPPRLPLQPLGLGTIPMMPQQPLRGGGYAIPFVRVGFAGRGAHRGWRGRGGHEEGGGGGGGAAGGGEHGGGGAPA